MAQINTGKAFFLNLKITISQGGAQTTETKSILDAIPDTAYSAISQQNFVNLTEIQAQARYTAFQNYLFGLYPGFTAGDIMNQPIETNTGLCPI